MPVALLRLIKCSFCPGEYVLFKFETAPPPRDMRACVHRHARMSSCDCTRMPPRDMRACDCTRMPPLSRHARHYDCAHARLRLHAHAAHLSRVPSVQASTFSSKLRRRSAEEKSSRGPEAAADAAPAAAAERGGDGVQGPPAPAAAGGAVDA
jgi:hypothetical protein